jgi:dTDP-4-dehydrorhamnose 3,5-epimerase
MVFRPTEISDVVVIEVEPRGDERGFLARAYCEHEFARGLHFQESPHWEMKLVRCTTGARLRGGNSPA